MVERSHFRAIAQKAARRGAEAVGKGVGVVGESARRVAVVAGKGMGNAAGVVAETAVEGARDMKRAAETAIAVTLTLGAYGLVKRIKDDAVRDPLVAALGTEVVEAIREIHSKNEDTK